MQNIKENFFKDLWDVIKATVNGFSEHKILKISASLAYTTIFSLAPLLMVILFVFDVLWSREAIEGTIYYQIENFIGSASAQQLQTMIKGLSISNKGSFAGTIGIVTLLIGATSVFAEIQDSINTIWGIRPKKQSGFWLYIKSRLLSFGVIGSLGFILLVSLGFSTLLDGLSNRLLQEFSQAAFYLVYIGNVVLTFIVISLLFGAIFTILPDAEISWKQVRVGSFVTALLFMAGKFLISYYIASSNVGSAYGAAGSFVILLLWVYYSSIILYIGATFAKNYAMEFSSPIKPSKFAEIVHNVEIISEKSTLQKAHKEKENLQELNSN